MRKHPTGRAALVLAVAVLSLSALTGTAHADPHAGYIRYGATGDPAWCVQTGLKLSGYSLDADGQWGDITQGKVVAFQKAHQLEPDGIVGPWTGDLLYQAIEGRLDTASDNACYWALPTRYHY